MLACHMAVSLVAPERNALAPSTDVKFTAGTWFVSQRISEHGHNRSDRSIQVAAKGRDVITCSMIGHTRLPDPAVDRF